MPKNEVPHYFVSIDRDGLPILEKVEKEKAIKKAKLEKELEAIQKELSVL